MLLGMSSEERNIKPQKTTSQRTSNRIKAKRRPSRKLFVILRHRVCHRRGVVPSPCIACTSLQYTQNQSALLLSVPQVSVARHDVVCYTKSGIIISSLASLVRPPYLDLITVNVIPSARPARVHHGLHVASRPRAAFFRDRPAPLGVYLLPQAFKKTKSHAADRDSR